MATILRMAAEAMSSPLGWPTRVIPRYFTLNTIPSNRVSFVSVQFSGSSGKTSSSQNKVLSYFFFLETDTLSKQCICRLMHITSIPKKVVTLWKMENQKQNAIICKCHTFWKFFFPTLSGSVSRSVWSF